MKRLFIISICTLMMIAGLSSFSFATDDIEKGENRYTNDWNEGDLNKDGKWDSNEYNTYFGDKEGYNEDYFNRYDKNKDNSWDENEWNSFSDDEGVKGWFDM